MLRKQLWPAIALTFVLMILAGGVYPGVVTVLAQLLFPRQANGSLIAGADGRVIGSALIGQRFSRREYFHPRPSGAGAGYDDTLSGGTNRGPTDRELADVRIAGAVERAVAEEGVERGKVPSDMVTSSGSGLDPDISPANAELQVARVARARGVAPSAVRRLLRRHTTGRQFGLFGDPRVNVLLLNIALDSAFGRPPATSPR